METGPCFGEEKAAGKRLAWPPQPMMSSHQVAAVQSQRDISEKSIKNPEKELIHRENGEKEEKAQRKPGKEKYLLTPIPCPRKGMLGPA